jgi:hypothetical protein
MQKTDNHEFGGENDHTNFKQSYLGLRVTKSSSGYFDRKLEKRRTRWYSKCGKIESVNCSKMQNTDKTQIQVKNRLCRLQIVIPQATSNEIGPAIAQWNVETEEKKPKRF